MSQERYNRLWIEARAILSNTIEDDNSLIAMNPFKSGKIMLTCLQDMYLRYGEIANQFCQVNDNIRDPVIAEQSRRFLEATLSRYLQIKEEISLLEGDHYSDLNQLLTEKNSTAFDVQLRVPLYFQREREKNVELRERLLEEAKYAIQLELDEENKEQLEENQNHDAFYEYEYDFEQFVEETTPKGERLTEDSSIVYKEPLNASQMKSVPLIQKCLNSYSKRLEYLQFIGMERTPSREAEIHESDLSAAKKSQEQRNKTKENIEKKQKQIKETFIRQFGHYIKYGLTEEIRAWYTEFYTITKEFPYIPPLSPTYAVGPKLGIPKGVTPELLKSFPSPDEDYLKNNVALELAGMPKYEGTALIQLGHWINAQEYLLIKADSKSKDKNKDKNEQEELLDSDTDTKTKKALKTSEYRINPSECMLVVKHIEEDVRSHERSTAYAEDWEERLKSGVCAEVNLEIRKQIDESMQKELNKLSRTTKNKHKETKEQKNKVKKVQTYNMDMVKNLVKHDVIHDGQGSQLRDYQGERRIVLSSPGDIIDQILAYGIIPMGSSVIHQLAPLTRSLCLIAPEHSGKSFLADAIITETGATLFEIGPDYLQGQYQDSQELKGLAKSITLVARALQPSVILVKNVEKVFYKKIPESEKEMKPQRLQSVLRKISKEIKQQDQVLLVGTSSFPWLAKTKAMNSAFNKFITVPSPSYGTYLKEWERFFKENSIPLNHIPFANVATTESWSPRCGIVQFEKLFSEAAVEQKDNKEIIGNLLQHMNPTNDSDNIAKFLSSTPLGKKKGTID